MSTESVAPSADLVPLRARGISANPARQTVESEVDDPTGIRLREALAREAALLREKDELVRKLYAWREEAANHVGGLTPRQRKIMELVVGGLSSKCIAAELGISQRTVENHRAAIMRKTSVKSVPALVQLALAVSGNLVGSFRG
jgi:DNA-binding CsgD family transcriptional regulator